MLQASILIVMPEASSVAASWAPSFVVRDGAEGDNSALALLYWQPGHKLPSLFAGLRGLITHSYCQLVRGSRALLAVVPSMSSAAARFFKFAASSARGVKRAAHPIAPH